MSDHCTRPVRPRTVVFRAGAAAVATFAVAAWTPEAATAQIVPETSGSPAAANSPAAAVQTGSRRRIPCDPCLRAFGFDRDDARDRPRSGPERPIARLDGFDG